MITNYSKLSNKFRFFALTNLFFQTLILPAILRQDSFENPLDINEMGDTIKNTNLLRQGFSDALRSSFGGGGENLQDIPLTIFPSYFNNVFDVKRKNEETDAAYNGRRGLRILLGILIVTTGFVATDYLKLLHANLAKNVQNSRTALVLLQGFTGTLFSFMFVVGLIMFSCAFQSIIADISKKLERKKDTEDSEIERKGGETLNKTFLAIGFICVAVVGSEALLLLSKKFAQLAEESKQFATIYNLLSTSFLVLSILFGISILGRRFLEPLLKNSIVKALPKYNSLLGKDGIDDEFTNDAINNNARVTYGYNVEGCNLTYIAIPYGYKLSNTKKRSLAQVNDNSGTKTTHAYDAEGNFYAVEQDETQKPGKKSNRNKAIARLIGYSLILYGALFLLYGAVFLCGNGLEKILVNIAKGFHLPECFGVIGNDIINNVFYLTAVLVGIQAINCLLKVVNIISFNKNFVEEIKNTQNAHEDQAKADKDVKSMHSANNAKFYVFGAFLVADTVGAMALVTLLAEKKIEFSLLIPVLTIAIITIGRICLALMTKYAGQNIMIEGARPELFSKKREESNIEYA